MISAFFGGGIPWFKGPKPSFGRYDLPKYMLQVLCISSFELILCIVIRHLENNSTEWKISMVIFKISAIQKLSTPPFICRKQKNCNWGRLQRRVIRRRSDCGLCETPIGTSPATSVRRFCLVGFVSLTQSSFEAPCHTYSSIYMTIYYICIIYINIYSQVHYIFWNNLPKKPATRFGSCVSSAEPDSSCSVLDDRVPSVVVLFTCTIQSNLYKFSKHKCSKHHHLGSQQ